MLGDASFCCGRHFDEVFADEVLCHKWEPLEEPLVCCVDECCDWRTENGLVHVFQSILQVRDRVDVVRCMLFSAGLVP